VLSLVAEDLSGVFVGVVCFFYGVSVFFYIFLDLDYSFVLDESVLDFDRLFDLDDFTLRATFVPAMRKTDTNSIYFLKQNYNPNPRRYRRKH